MDIFIAGVGTGDAISGAGLYLKGMSPGIWIVAAEPAASSVLSGVAPGTHRIQGIGAGFMPETLDTRVYDEIIQVENVAAFAAGQEVARIEGVLAGISSGAALWAAAQILRRMENGGKTALVLFPDSGARYLSTPMFASKSESCIG